MSRKSPAMSRRQFLARTGQTAAGLFAAGALSSCTGNQTGPAVAGRVIGANERINMAIIGVGGRGGSLARGFAGIPNVRVKTLCDIDENLLAGRVKQVESAQGSAPGTEYDLRRVFEDKEIDAVATATPNHWHALVTVWGCQAGKHVYVEKPCSHNIWEGRRMVEAARRHNCIVQVGFQSRSSTNVRQAMKFIHEGGLGEIYMAKGLCYKPRESIGRCPDGHEPGRDYEYYVHGKRGKMYDGRYFDKVHYDLFLGPAPERAFNYNRFHYNWHWHWDYGNGDIGNQGVHQMDLARWGLGKNEHPVKVSSHGGYFVFDSAQETPNTQTASFEYADGKILQFEVRGLNTNDESSVRIGNLFFGSKGWMHLNSGGDTWATFFGRKNEPGPTSESADAAADPSDFTSSGGGGHFGNFINAVRSGKRQELSADIEGGHLSAALCHLANTSYRLGRNLTFDGTREKFVGDKEANKMVRGFPQLENGRLIKAKDYRRPFTIGQKV